MPDAKQKLETIDAYIDQFQPQIKEKLLALRELIKTEAPQATERMSWQMPTFYLFGNLVHFAAFKNHIGFYPGNSGINAFQSQFTDYKWSKGAVQFPLTEPLPFDLIREIVRFRMAENLRDAAAKGKPKH